MQVYTVGHRLAIEKARKAHDDANNLELLKEAFVYEGFALHFLEDSFSAGHIRVPRKELAKVYGDKIGGVLTKAMHDEESHEGILVTSRKHPKEWKCYGDGNLFAPEAAEHYKQTQAAVDESIIQVAKTFDGLTTDVQTVLQYVPTAVDKKNPLFEYKNGNEFVMCIVTDLIRRHSYQR